MKLIKANRELWDRIISRWNNEILKPNRYKFEIIQFEILHSEMKNIGAENIINYVKSEGWTIVGISYREDLYFDVGVWILEVIEDSPNTKDFHDFLPDIKFNEFYCEEEDDEDIEDEESLEP